MHLLLEICKCFEECVMLHTVYDRIEARAFISYKSFLTRCLNETGINLDPGVYFLLATR